MLKKITLVDLDIDGVDFSKPIDGGVADNTQHREQPSGANKIVTVLRDRGYACEQLEARKMWVSFSRKRFQRDWENISFNTVPCYSDAQIFENVRPFFREVDGGQANE
jgi:hypothetical protein